jgi:hypothetical protein
VRTLHIVGLIVETDEATVAWERLFLTPIGPVWCETARAVYDTAGSVDGDPSSIDRVARSHSDYKRVAGAERVDGLLELPPTAGVLAAGLLAEDDIALGGTERGDLASRFCDEVETRALSKSSPAADAFNRNFGVVPIASN